MNDILEAAKNLLSLGYSVIPVEKDKRPPKGFKWQRFQKKAMTSYECDAYFENAWGVAIICGAVSGNLLCIDFDSGAEKYHDWVHEAQKNWMHDGGQLDLYTPFPYLFETSPNGIHIYLRCDSNVNGNEKLANRDTQVLIETRGEGGYVICAPTPGYTIKNDFDLLLEPANDQGVSSLLRAARALDEVEKNTTFEFVADKIKKKVTGLRPGDDYNIRGDMQQLLINHGWQPLDNNENQHWCRPGKSGSSSATLKNGVFWNFSSSVKLSTTQPYCAFQLFAALEFHDDFIAAAAELRRRGYGDEEWTVEEEPDQAKPNMVYKLQELVFDQSIQLQEEIIPSYLRRGEVMNVIAAPKTRKSWFVMQLAIAAARGDTFINIPFKERLNVLMVDNELHIETLTVRMRHMLNAMNISKPPDITVMCLRAHGITLENLHEHLPDGPWDLVILDALYRFIPAGTSENDNADMVQLYNKLDMMAKQMAAALVVVHHTSKGSQGDRGLTDIGAGAGAQSRAADTHMVLLTTDEDDEDAPLRLSAVARSFPPNEDKFIMFDKYVWKCVDKPIEHPPVTPAVISQYVSDNGGNMAKSYLELEFCTHGAMSGVNFKRMLAVCLENKSLYEHNNLYSTTAFQEKT